MRFPTASRFATLLCLAFALGASACIFGPKHEDPGDEVTRADSGVDAYVGMGDTTAPEDTPAVVPDVSAPDSGPLDRNCDADVGEVGCGDGGGGGEAGDADAGDADATDASDAAEVGTADVGSSDSTATGG